MTAILNPCDEFVAVLKHDIKDNNGYCIETEERNKNTKCPKYCKRDPNKCTCGMYINNETEL